ncbi:site-specific integrase [Coriobacteriaceae bacterium]|nr:site-specific integrase [Coriobacteriaceae bacterium]
MKYSSGRVERRKAPHKGWRAVLDYEEGGKRKRKTRSLDARTKTEANRQMNAWWAEMEAEAERRAAEPPTPAEEASSVTVGEWVSDQIAQMGAVGSITPTTVAGYRHSAKLLSPIAGTPLDRLDRAAVAGWMAGLTGRGLSSSTVGKSFRLLKQCMSIAVRDEMLLRNPCDGVRPPKREKVRPGINALDSAERSRLKALLASVEPDPMVVGASVALYTGLRRGEVCGLRWRDVDLDRGVLWVRKAIGVADGRTYLKDSKTGHDRDVALPATLVDALREWRRDPRSGEVYVVGRGDRWADPSVLGREWGVFAKLNGVRGTEGRLCTFHDLRHTWATAAVAAGIDIKTVSSNLGHANAAMTLNIYASADPEAKRRAAEVMDSVI